MTPESVYAAARKLLGNHFRVTRRDVDAISRIIKGVDPWAKGS